MPAPRTHKGVPLGVLDSAISSASNFLLSGLALAVLDAGEFALVSLMQAGHVILLALNRSAFFEALLIRQRERFGVEATTALALSCRFAVVASLGTSLLGLMTANATLVIFGLGIVPLAAADSLRFLSFTDEAPWLAIRVDVTWLAVQASLAAVLLGTGNATAWSLVLVWWAGAFTAVLLNFRSMSWSWRATSQDRRRFFADKDLRLGLVVDALSARAAPAISLFLVAAVLSVDELALVSGPRALFGPVNVVFAAALSVGLATASRLASTGELRRFIAVLGGAMTTVVLAIGLGFISLSRWLSEVLDGLDDYRLNLRIVLLATALVAVAWSTSLGVALRSQEDTTTSARIQLVAGLLLVVGSVLGAVIGGAVGVLAGQAVGRWLGTLGWFIGSRRSVLRSSPDVTPA